MLEKFCSVCGEKSRPPNHTLCICSGCHVAFHLSCVYEEWKALKPDSHLSDTQGMRCPQCEVVMVADMAAAEAVRDKLELSAHMVGFGNMERMAETRAYRYSMDFQFWTPR